MGKLKPSEGKALAWYCEEHTLKPQLSVYPIFRFKDNDGKITEVHIDSIRLRWERWRKEQK
jgi:hypothetical protein